MTTKVSGKVLALAAVFMAIGSTAQAADNYPDRPIKLIVPFGAGGASDVMARKFGEKLSTKLGQPIAIENQAAAAGTLAYVAAARAAPDGYTLLFGTVSLVVNAVLKVTPPYDPIKSFKPVAGLFGIQNVLVVPTDSPAKTAGDLVALLKSKPKEITYVSLGVGSSPHLAAELFLSATGTKGRHVPYKQTGQAYTDLIENRVQFWIASFPSAFPHIQTGKLRALAFAGSQRSPSLPNVPTLTEEGINVSSTFWNGLFVPAGTPDAIVQKLTKASKEVLTETDTKEWYNNIGSEVDFTDAGQLAALLKAELTKWDKIATDIGLERD